MVGHIVNPRGIPEHCPGCQEEIAKVGVKVIDYDAMWHDGKVVCGACGHYLRDYDAG